MYVGALYLIKHFKIFLASAAEDLIIDIST